MSNVKDLVGYQLRELDDVNTAGITIGQGLVWNGSLFVPGSVGSTGTAPPSATADDADRKFTLLESFGSVLNTSRAISGLSTLGLSTLGGVPTPASFYALWGCQDYATQVARGTYYNTLYGAYLGPYDPNWGGQTYQVVSMGACALTVSNISSVSTLRIRVTAKINKSSDDAGRIQLRQGTNVLVTRDLTTNGQVTHDLGLVSVAPLTTTTLSLWGTIPAGGFGGGQDIVYMDEFRLSFDSWI